jgi:SAM-dependent methyltransferase
VSVAAGHGAIGAVEASSIVARTLQIEPDTWRAVLSAFEARLAPAPPGEDEDGEIARCLAALAPAYRALSPHEAAPPTAGGPRACPACARAGVRPLLARRSSPPAPDLVYGRCDFCGHGALLDDAGETASIARHTAPGYFRGRDGQGAGYADYGREAAYREGKGAALIDRLRATAARPIAALLEVGSAYGFARAAAERAGVRTAGVDVSAHAVAEAARNYGLETFCGTLADALASSRSGIARGTFDAVLYQFVLEHVADPVGELARAREALVADGWLVLLVPSMEAAEIDAFGASYRSFRGDHLHLFSRVSLATALERAGFALREVESHCNLHLFRGLLSPRALAHLYSVGRGPDLLVLAQRRP